MRRTLLTACVLLSTLNNPSLAIEPDAPAFVHEPTESYAVRNMRGFTVRVSSAAMAHPKTTEPALRLLDEQLRGVLELTPDHTHETLRKVVFWVEQNNPGFPCACYHPGAPWLRDNGYNTDKEKGIEIANPEHFVLWVKRDQPMMVLHELAHAYHDLAVGYGNELIRSCYEQAKASGKYDSVMHVSGKKCEHYALTNDREYFAELTESYFGRNDFQPFKRNELKQFDPQGYSMIERLWLRPIDDE